MTNRKTRILFIAPLPPPTTGQAVAVEALLEGLRQEYDFTLINLSPGKFRQKHRIIGNINWILRIVFRILVKQREANVIYYTISLDRIGNLRDLLVYLVCFFKLPRMLLHLHGGKIAFGNGCFFYYLNRFFLKRVGRVVVLSSSLRNVLKGMASQEKISIIPNCVDNRMFLDQAAILNKYCQTRPLRLLFLSNFIPGKGYNELVEAYQGLSEEFKKIVKIDFAGEFISQGESSVFLDKIRGIENIAYLGVADDLRKQQLFLGAHIFCLPTYCYHEGQPIAILEAYASGCVVVTTGRGGIGDIFVDRINGFLVDSRSPVSIQKVIEGILKDPSELTKIALYNRELAKERFNKSKYLVSFREIIDKLKLQNK